MSSFNHGDPASATATAGGSQAQEDSRPGRDALHEVVDELSYL